MPIFRPDDLRPGAQPATSDESTNLLLSTSAIALVLGALLIVAATGKLSLVRWLYPAAMVGLGGFFLWLRPSWFLGLAWWVWLFTPLIRRILDYHLGYLDINPVTLAPLALSGLAGVAILRSPAVLASKRYLPFAFALTGIAFGYAVGLFRWGMFAPTFKMLEYVSPLLFGLYLALDSDGLERNYRTILFSILVAGSISAMYGILQFFWIPPWDQYWMVASNSYMPRDIAPGEFRIFGTVNSTHPFGYMMVAGLVMALGYRSRRGFVLAIPILAALLLSWTRAAWGTWVVAVAASFLLARGETRRSIGRFAVAGVLVIVVLLSAGPLGSRIALRMDTIATLSDDGSLGHRTNLYLNRSVEMLTSPIGAGLGTTGKAAKLSVGKTVNVDSGLITIPWELGWVGASLYILGLGMLVFRLLRYAVSDNPRLVATAGGVVGLLAASVFVNSFNGVHAMILWTFVGLSYAGTLRYRSYGSQTDGPATLLSS